MDAFEHWRELFVTPDDPAVRAAFTDLAGRYSQPHRHYHTLAHVLGMLDALRGQALPERRAVELAVWFHDAVYDPRRADNEERSAQLALGTLTSLGLGAELAGRVAQLVLATRAHEPTRDPALRWLLDADLAVLGSGAASYAAYVLGVRREYAWVPEEAFRSARRRILEGFLARSAIYQTAHFARLEARARENLLEELGGLRS